ncbi:hypothetical protein HYPSUDRAFT_59983 [Hypholoma sublateritium FD-334 SS-4]|uniref:Uncharacterized protein n=1 Tax=Hypholoma sublateritium (strain FD-334 SS-4) TaxID=945553 RepID=A0A0D2KFT4_HYPSF|nr:hypothetical protein HYPSUDRAFT_59983 [Hypholoma sublateritium FD-334 SS-4]
MPGYFVPISSLFSKTASSWDWSACQPIDSDEIIPTSDTNEVELPHIKKHKKVSFQDQLEIRVEPCNKNDLNPMMMSRLLAVWQNSDFFARHDAEWAQFERDFPDFVAWNNLRNANKKHPENLDNPTMEAISSMSDGPLIATVEVTESPPGILTTENVAPQDDSVTESDPEFDADIK